MFVAAALLLVTAPARGEQPPLDDDPRAPADPAMPTPAPDTASLAESPASSQASKLDLTLPPPINGGDAVPWPHYDQGFVLVPTLDPVATPYRLRLNHVSQFRYTNTKDVNPTYTDHLGNVKDVPTRNDIQLTRDVFYFSGFLFDRRLDFNILLFTSSATLTAVVAGYVGFVFNKAFALRIGYFSLPAVRSLSGVFPFFQSTDRSLADNYMRPGFTVGGWADGELFPGFNYIAMVGNSLNTLDIPAARINNDFAGAVSVWYDLHDFGKPWNDLEYHTRPSLRIGTAFTFAREDRLSDLSTPNPENNSIYISDGSLLFATGSVAPNVTIQLADYFLSAIDAGFKYRGLAVNAQLYQRWLNRFTADGPLPISSMYDWGFEASVGYFVVRSILEPYVRTSAVRGPFGKSIEGAGGLNWYPLDTRGVWLNAEAIGIRDSPYTSAFYPYVSGQTGLLVQSQLIVRF
jgi:hypothetical protein